MRRPEAVLRHELVRHVAANCGARVLAVAGLAASTLLVARVAGPAGVGTYALLRMLPGLVGVLCVGGLPGALAYFLAAPRRTTPALWPTLLGVGLVGSVVGSLAWAVAAPEVTHVFFTPAAGAAVGVATVTVSTQLLLTLGKTALQGLGDRRGGDLVIAAEEILFLPCYALVLVAGGSGAMALVVSLALADVVVGAAAWQRVCARIREQHGLPAHRVLRGRPDPALAREVVGYGLRGQVGGLLTLVNLRLDFALLGAMAGPAVLGTYAVASKYAELLRLPGTALTWVSYPRLASATAAECDASARRLVRPALVGVVLAAVPMLALAPLLITLLYGEEFAAAVAQSQVLLVGMLLGGAAGTASGYLFARGRPGLNSWAMGLGVAVTVALDLVLIPRHGALGAAYASTVAYLLSDSTLVVLLLVLTRRARTSTRPTSPPVEVSP